MPSIQELRDERARLAKQAEDLLSAQTEFKMRAEDEAKFDAIHKDIDAIAGHIKRMEALDALNQPAERRTEPTHPTNEPRTESRIVRPVSPRDRTEGLRSWLLAGSDVERTPAMQMAADRCGYNLSHKSINLRLPDVALRSTRPDDIRMWEQRAGETMGVGSAGIGLNTVPDETMRAMEIALLSYGGMREVATVLRTDSGAALPIPMVNDTANAGVLLAENTTTTEYGITFGQLVLGSFKYSSKYVLVSVELLQDSGINLPQFIGEALGTRIGRITNTHFTTGDESGKPHGLMHATTEGKAGASGQALTVIYDDLVDLVHSVDPAYRRNGRFMFADSTLKALKKIKIPQYSGDTIGLPLWQPSMSAAQPDSILGYPYTINQDVAAMAGSAKSIAFGDLSKYIIRDVRDITLLRLDERFAELHQVAFLAFYRGDGDLLNAGTNPVKHYANPAA